MLKPDSTSDFIDEIVGLAAITPNELSAPDGDNDGGNIINLNELSFPDGDNDGGSVINLMTTDTLLVECIGLNNDRVNKFFLLSIILVEFSRLRTSSTNIVVETAVQHSTYYRSSTLPVSSNVWPQDFR